MICHSERRKLKMAGGVENSPRPFSLPEDYPRNTRGGGGYGGMHRLRRIFLENSRTKNSRRECRLSVLAIPVGARVGAYVCAYVRAYVCAYVARPIQTKKTTHKNGLNSGLYDLIGIRLLKRIINSNKRPKIKPYGRVRFLSVIQRA